MTNYKKRITTSFCFICGSRLRQSKNFYLETCCSHDRSHFKRIGYRDIKEQVSIYYTIGKYLVINNYRGISTHTTVFETGDINANLLSMDDGILEIYPETTEDVIDNYLLVE